MHNGQLVLKAYQKAINKIDDYFEYGYDSKKDRARVMAIIDALRKELEKVHG